MEAEVRILPTLSEGASLNFPRKSESGRTVEYPSHCLPLFYIFDSKRKEGVLYRVITPSRQRKTLLVQVPCINLKSGGRATLPAYVLHVPITPPDGVKSSQEFLINNRSILLPHSDPVRFAASHNPRSLSYTMRPLTLRILTCMADTKGAQ